MPIFSMAEWRSGSGRRENNEKRNKNKPRVDYEPSSAPGRAVKKSRLVYIILYCLISIVIIFHNGHVQVFICIIVVMH